MKKFVIILMAFVLFAGMAMAEKPVFEKPLAPNSYTPNGRAAEVEDNGTPATANPLTVGDDMSAAIATETDEDFFSFAATGGVEYVFETNPGDVVDTVMYLYDTDGVTELTSDDDGGAGLYSRISFNFAADGTYFVKVVGYGSRVGTYILTASLPCEVPVNNTCAGALPLPFDGTFIVSNCGATDDFSPFDDTCTGYSTAAGNDLVYSVNLITDQQFTVSVNPAVGFFTDLSIYLVTDCSDMSTCVAGADSGNPETIIFDASTNPGTYYLILDTYFGDAETEFEVTVDGVVATDNASFGTLKSMYR